MLRKQAVWILDTDQDMLRMYRNILDSDQYPTQYFRSLSALRNAFEKPESIASTKPSLCLTEYSVEDGTILEVVQKNKIFDCPYMVISVNDKIEALNACLAQGALDYLCKPCNPTELTVKLNRFFLGNPSGTKKQKSNENEIVFSPQSFSLKRGLESIKLTAKELQIFSVLNGAVGKTFTRKEIQKRVWQNVSVTPKTFDVHLFNLRKKIWELGVEIRFCPPDSYVLTHNAAIQK